MYLPPPNKARAKKQRGPFSVYSRRDLLSFPGLDSANAPPHARHSGRDDAVSPRVDLVACRWSVPCFSSHSRRRSALLAPLHLRGSGCRQDSPSMKWEGNCAHLLVRTPRLLRQPACIHCRRVSPLRKIRRAAEIRTSVFAYKGFSCQTQES